jgi:hypothetical protein
MKATSGTGKDGGDMCWIARKNGHSRQPCFRLPGTRLDDS